MDDFSAIRFKRKTIKRFKRFSKQIARTHSGTLEAMMDFFENNGISPYETLGANMATLESKIKRRINALIAIVKDIEKNQTKPTNAMMNLLFKEAEQEDGDEQVLLDDVLTSNAPNELFSEAVELDYYREQYFTTKGNLDDLKKHLETALSKTTYVRGNFSGGYYRMNITKETFETLKQTLEHVHHHNTSKTER